MEAPEKLAVLKSAANFDVCGFEGTHGLERSPYRFLYNATMRGSSICLFKVLQTNVCINDCTYCVNQVGRDCPRFTFQPDELARLFMELNRKGIARGLFLSSAVAVNPSRTMEHMLATVEILRKSYEYIGYIHLKIMPGASYACVETACKLANRVSVNIEAPTVKHLGELSRRKNLYHDILERMRWVKQITTDHHNWTTSGQTTQFVVGAAGETDRELLGTTHALYKEVSLRRAYFSAFTPIAHSRLQDNQPTSPWREHRLYQTDWLLRIYGFALPEVELALDKDGFLPLRQDPKVTIVRKQPWLFPVDINRASLNELLHVPGVGPISANRIVAARRDHSIDSLVQLKKMRVVVKRASPYIWFRSMLSSEKQSTFLPEIDKESAVPEPSLALACR